jgi:hypothetical protein
MHKYAPSVRHSPSRLHLPRSVRSTPPHRLRRIFERSFVPPEETELEKSVIAVFASERHESEDGIERIEEQPAFRPACVPATAGRAAQRILFFRRHEPTFRPCRLRELPKLRQSLHGSKKVRTFYHRVPGTRLAGFTPASWEYCAGPDSQEREKTSLKDGSGGIGAILGIRPRL